VFGSHPVSKSQILKNWQKPEGSKHIKSQIPKAFHVPESLQELPDPKTLID
jgi:hypothetical protein